MTEDNKKYEPQGTKISPEMAVVWDRICEALHTDTYHILQGFIYSMIRASNEQHELTPEIQKLMTIIKMESGWQNAFNLCNPDGLHISQAILILEQENKKGYGAVMIDKPWMGVSTQTESSEEILMRVLNVTMPGVYMKMRRLQSYMHCKTMTQVLLEMIDTQTTLEMEQEYQRETSPANNIAENGKAYAYGKKAKAKQRRTPDGEAARQQRIMFDDIDRDIADSEVDDWEGEHRGSSPDDIEQAIGCKPFDVEP